jgi:hypothetical protein
MPRPRKEKYCVACLGPVINPENIKKKGYACDRCRIDGKAFFCGKCGYQKTPDGVLPPDAQCQRCSKLSSPFPSILAAFYPPFFVFWNSFFSDALFFYDCHGNQILAHTHTFDLTLFVCLFAGPPTSSLVFRNARDDMKEPDLEVLFISVLTEYYSHLPAFQDRLASRLDMSFQELKKEVASGDAIAVAALSPGAPANKFVGFMSAKMDRANRIVVVMYVVITQKCRGHRIFHHLATQLYSELVLANEQFDQVYFVADSQNESVLGASVKYFFEEVEGNVFATMQQTAAHKSMACKGDNLVKLKELLGSPIVKQDPATQAKKAGRPKKDETFRKLLAAAQEKGTKITSLSELPLPQSSVRKDKFKTSPTGEKRNKKKKKEKKQATYKSDDDDEDDDDDDDNSSPHWSSSESLSPLPSPSNSSPSSMSSVIVRGKQKQKQNKNNKHERKQQPFIYLLTFLGRSRSRKRKTAATGNKVTEVC